MFLRRAGRDFGKGEQFDLRVRNGLARRAAANDATICDAEQAFGVSEVCVEVSLNPQPNMFAGRKLFHGESLKVDHGLGHTVLQGERDDCE